MSSFSFSSPSPTFLILFICILTLCTIPHHIHSYSGIHSSNGALGDAQQQQQQRGQRKQRQFSDEKVTSALPPYQPPSLHPYQSDLELHLSEKLDPYGFPTNLYSSSQWSHYQQQQQQQNNDNPNTFRKRDASQQHNNPSSPRTIPIQQSHLPNNQKISARMLTAVVDISPYFTKRLSHNILRIYCDSAEERRELMRWIPGTRMILDKTADDDSVVVGRRNRSQHHHVESESYQQERRNRAKGQRQQQQQEDDTSPPIEYFLLVRRRRIVGFLFEYEIQQLRFHELFHDISIDLTHEGKEADEGEEDSHIPSRSRRYSASSSSPPSSEEMSQAHISSTVNSDATTRVPEATLTEPSILHPLNAAHRNTHKRGLIDDIKDELDDLNPKFSLDTARSFNLLNFNYDRNEAKAEEAISLYDTRGSGDAHSFYISCTNCYAYITFLLRFKMEATLKEIRQFSVLLNGQAVVNVESEFLFEYNLQKTFTKADILTQKLSSIKFSVGGIPVVIVPRLSLHAEARVDIKARAHLTHKASYREAITAGVTYSNGKFNRIFQRDTPQIYIGKPEIASDNGITASLNARMFLIPEVAFRVYDLAPVVIRLKSYIELDGSIGKGSVCAQNAISARYQFYWGLQAQIQMEELSIPSSVYALGGKSFDLGNTLPFPKKETDLEFEVVPLSPLQCRFCSGCVNLESLADKLSFAIYQLLPTSFTKFLEVELGQIGNATLEDISASAPNNCHLFKTAEISFGNDAKIDFSVIASGKVRIYHGNNQEEVKQKTSEYEDLNPPLKKFTQLEFQPPSSSQPSFFSVCPQDDALNGTKLSYEFLARQVLEPLSDSDKIPIPEDKAITLRKQLHPTVNNAFTNIATVLLDDSKSTLSTLKLLTVPTGSTDLSSADVLGEGFADYSQIIFDIPKTLQNDMSLNDFIINVDTISKGKATDLIVKSLPFVSAVIDQKIDLDSKVEHLRVPRGDSSNIWKYVIESVQDGTRRKRDTKAALQNTVSIYSGYIHETDGSIDLTLPLGGEHSFSVNDFPVNPVDPSFWIKIDSSATAGASLKVKEYRYLRSGLVNTFSLSDVSQFVLFQDANRGHKRNQISISSSASLASSPLDTCSSCTYNLEVSLEMEQENSHRSLLWSKTYSVSGDFSTDIFVSDLVKETDHSLDKLQDALVFVKAVSLDRSKEMEISLMTSDITYFEEKQTRISGRLEQPSGASTNSEMLYFKLPRSLIESFERRIQLRFTADSADVDPEIFIQKNGYPLRDSFALSKSGVDTQKLSIGFVAEEDQEYFVGISSTTSSFSFEMQVESLEPADVLVEISVLDRINHARLMISDNDIREFGLCFNFTILNRVHEFSTDMFNLTYGDSPQLRTLIALIDASGDGSYSMTQLTGHMRSLLDRALFPSSATGDDGMYSLSDFVLFSKHRLSLIMQPLKNFELSDEMRLKIAGGTTGSRKRFFRGGFNLPATSLPAELFSTRDSRNKVSTSSTEVIFFKSGSSTVKLGSNLVAWIVFTLTVCICAGPVFLVFLFCFSGGFHLAVKHGAKSKQEEEAQQKKQKEQAADTKAPTRPTQYKAPQLPPSSKPSAPKAPVAAS